MSMSIFLAILIFVAAAGYLFAPLFSSLQHAVMTVAAPKGRSLENLTLKKEEVLLSLKDLDLDHQLKKLSDEDYHILYNETFREGTALLQQIDEENAKKPAAPAGAISGAAKFCAECGEQLVPHAKFCTQCGTAIQVKG